MSAEKRSVSAEADLWAKADARAQELGYSKFSEYVQALIRADVLARASHIREANAPAPPPPGPGSSTYRTATKKDTEGKILDIVKEDVAKAKRPRPRPK